MYNTYGYVDLVDKRHIICRQVSRSGITAKNVHCRTEEEAEVMLDGMRKNLEQGFSIAKTHGLGFKYFVVDSIGDSVGEQEKYGNGSTSNAKAVGQG